MALRATLATLPALLAHVSDYGRCLLLALRPLPALTAQVALPALPALPAQAALLEASQHYGRYGRYSRYAGNQRYPRYWRHPKKPHYWGYQRKSRFVRKRLSTSGTGETCDSCYGRGTPVEYYVRRIYEKSNMLVLKRCRKIYIRASLEKTSHLAYINRVSSV